MALSLSTLTDAFTGQPVKDAAAQQRALYDSTGRLITGQLQGAQQQGLAALQSGQANALGAVQGGTTQARSDIAAATPQALSTLQAGATTGANALQAGQAGGLAALQSGVDTARQDYNNLAGISSGYGQLAGGAGDIYSSIIGASDPSIAKNAFTTSPGYQFALEQGLEGITRGANTSGMAAGGNQLRAAGEYATNAANQEYQKYVDNVMAQQQLYAPLEASTANQVAAGTSGAALTGATGAANIYTGTGSQLSDLASKTGAAGAGILTNEGATLADLASKGGTTSANIFTQGGQSEADLIKSITGQQVDYTKTALPAQASTYGAEAQAAMGGSNSLWNLIGGATTAAAGLPKNTFTSLLPASGGGSAYGPVPRIGA